MEDFAEYNTWLEQIFHLWTNNTDNTFSNESTTTASIVRRLIDISALRESGVFFTSDTLAEKTINSFNKPINDSSFIVDPTCGSGSLLVAASRKLNIFDGASQTLEQWGNQLCGFDIYPEFVACTKMRIILEVLIRGATPDKSLKELLALLPNIRRDDCLKRLDIISKATHLAFNPPYNNSKEIVQYSWASGKISNAAIYFFEITSLLQENCSISAILPDVLRSGSRFEAWRAIAETTLASTTLTIEGRFDSKTDIDIFLLSGVIKKSAPEKIEWQKPAPHVGVEAPTVGDYFNISVGAVVPFRDPQEGPLYSYIHPKTLPRWGKISKITEKRRFLGTVVQPPFIAIRRTSGPRDSQRAVPTLVLGKRLVAVENHLLVLAPKNGELYQCEELLSLLSKEYVNDFLNNRIRCRHLTVSAVSEIPWRLE
jgi:hypothetical protein